MWVIEEDTLPSHLVLREPLKPNTSAGEFNGTTLAQN